jgi:hypothetical protein
VLRNDVMLRINDVALRAKGKLHFHNTNALDFGGFSCKKHTPFTIAPFPRPYGLELATLCEYIEFI